MISDNPRPQPVFNTPYNREHTPAEIGSGETTVDVAGYRDPREQIKALIAAGERLVQWRRLNYEFQSDQSIPENYVDPTRSRGYDVVDAERDLKFAKQNIAKAKKAAEEAKKQKEAEKKPNSVEEVK